MNDHQLIEDNLIEVVEVWGTDADICQRARVSTGSSKGGFRRNLRLLATLIREDHGSPLEFGGFVFRLQLPLFLAIQLLRHRIASYSMSSGRYQEMDMMFFAPAQWREQSVAGNRQTSGGPLPPDIQLQVSAIYGEVIAAVSKGYREMVSLGVAREQARILLSQSIYTELYAQFNLRSLMNFIRLRSASDAQPEWQPYVQAMADAFANAYPLLGGKIFPLALKIDQALKPLSRKLWKEEVDLYLEEYDNTGI